MADGQYRIFKAQYPLIAGAAGHNMLVLVDPDGRVIGELDGLATDVNGNVKPIGYLPSDTLKVHGNYGLYNPDLKKAELVSGDRSTIMNLWAAAGADGDRINALNLHYPFMGLGQNSNSVLSTLIAAMGVAEPSVGGAPLTPGEGSILLEPREIQQIQRQYKLNVPSSEGVQDATPSSLSPGHVDQPEQQGPPVVVQPPRGAMGAPTGRRAISSRRNGYSGATMSKPPDTAAPDAAKPPSTGRAIRSTPSVGPGASGPSGSTSGPRPMSSPLNFAPEEPQDFGPFTAPATLRSGLFGIGNASAADKQTASADANVPNSPAPASGVPTTSRPMLGNGRTSKLNNGNGIDGRSEGPVLVPSSAQELDSAAPSPRITPGGILGMLIDAGYLDLENPGRPPAGGLPGLIQDYMRINPV